MSAYIIDVAPFKKQHITAIALSFVPLVISYVLAQKGYSVINDPTVNEVIKWVFLAGALITSFMLTRKHKEQLKTIHTLANFEEQVIRYKKIYDQRVMINAVIGIVTAIIFALTARRIFLMVGIFNLVVLLIMFPNKRVFRLELNNQDIEFR
ncbi:hypothetical protein [Paraflavitalea speifideaquila]|uniref:hypothetical protein n=1 Tax=Paraflavitalea speifideaquila TaxID=3076558 RepID=UPI0028F041C4|nr:hypothetical protein [Paraflavitalea speifideiaquila]